MISLSTQELVKKTNEKDLETRLLAIKHLGMRYDPHSIEPLLKLLKDKHLQVREKAIYSLGAIGDREIIVDPIMSMLKDPILQVRLAAIKVLGELGVNRATKKLILKLSSKNKRERKFVVVALGQIKDKNALFPLIDELEEEDLGIKLNAIIALGKFNDPRAIEPLTKLLDQKPAVIKMAALTLGNFQDEAIVDPLVKLLDSNDPKIRQCAVYSLGKVHSPKIVEPMLRLLNDEDSSVRQSTIASLSDMPSDKIMGRLLDKLRDKEEEVRAIAAKALGKLGDKVASPALIHSLNDSNPDVRIQSLHSLGELEVASAIKPAMKAIKDDNPKVRKAALEAVGRIVSGRDYEETVKSKFEHYVINRMIKKGLKDEQVRVRVKAAESLAKVALSQRKFEDAVKYFQEASQESLSWDFEEGFFEACALGCVVLTFLSRGVYKEQTSVFQEIESLFKGSAKLFGVDKFVSSFFWDFVDNYNEVLRTEKKQGLAQKLKDLAMKLLVLTKKLPEHLQSIVDIPQQEFNKKYQFIEKKGLSVELAHEEMESLRDIVFNLACDVLRVEPLKLEQTGKTQDTIDLLEGLATNINSDINNVDLTSTQGLEVDTTDMITQMIRPEEELENTREKTFELKKIRFGFPTNDSPLKVDFSENLKIALIQLHKGVKRKSIVEEDWNLWKRGLDRYFNNQLFRQDKIFQFTDESNNMRVKPKIIGFMDDAIYEGANFVILPELSVPNNYLEKMQGYADHFDIFILTGAETKREGNLFHNRAYLIAPHKKEMEFQAKNYPTTVPTPELLENWEENLRVVKPPEIKVFETPFGRFCVLVGADIKKLDEYLPFIVREEELDFLVFLANWIYNGHTRESYDKLAKRLDIPIIFVNTGQFGGTQVFDPHKVKMNLEKENPLDEEFTDGIYLWNMKTPKWLKEKDHEN